MSTNPKARVVKQLLTVAVRFALRNSLRLREIVEMVKQVMVDCAIEELRRNNSAISGARLSVMTGVHRKDVDRLVHRHEEEGLSESSLISRVIGQWRSDPRYQDKLGRPKIVSLEARTNEFNALVRSVTTELNPSLVLAELERVGAVVRHRLGLKLLAHVYVPSAREEEYYGILSEDTRDLTDCIEHNIASDVEDKHLHIKTEYDGIPDELVAEVSEWVLREGTRIHKKFAEYLSAHDKETNPALRGLPGRNRFAVVSFGIATRSEERNESSKQKRRKK